MEPNEDLAARLARLDARRQSAPAAAGRSRRHPAHRSRIAATVLSATAMVGISGYMALQDQTSAATSTVVESNAASLSAAASGSTSSASTSKTVTAATSATASTQANTTSQGS